MCSRSDNHSSFAQKVNATIKKHITWYISINYSEHILFITFYFFIYYHLNVFSMSWEIINIDFHQIFPDHSMQLYIYIIR